jgi:hypothetical protein
VRAQMLHNSAFGLLFLLLLPPVCVRVACVARPPPHAFRADGNLQR